MAKDEIELNEENVVLDNSSDGLTLEDFETGGFVNTPKVGDEVVFTVIKVRKPVPAETIKRDNGQSFVNGLTFKDSKKVPFKQLIDTDLGVYNAKPWEVYLKLVGKKGPGVLLQYAKKHNNNFVGAKVSIKRLVNFGHANYSIPDLKRLMNFATDEETKTYKDGILKAANEQKIFEVKLLN